MNCYPLYHFNPPWEGSARVTRDSEVSHATCLSIALERRELLLHKWNFFEVG